MRRHSKRRPQESSLEGRVTSRSESQAIIWTPSPTAMCRKMQSSKQSRLIHAVEMLPCVCVCVAGCCRALGHMEMYVHHICPAVLCACDRVLMRCVFPNWLLGLVVCFSLRVREVPGSIPGAALASCAYANERSNNGYDRCV